MNRMNDLISRQAAINAIGKEKSLIERPITETRWFDLGLGKAQEVLSGLPSAQPEIIRCKDCKNWDRSWKSERPNYHYCPIIDGIRNGFWYCADGDRRGICNE